MPSLSGEAADEKPGPPRESDPATPQALCTRRPLSAADLDEPASTTSISSRLLYSADMPSSPSFVSSEDEELEDATPDDIHVHLPWDVRLPPMGSIAERPALEARLRPSGPGYIPDADPLASTPPLAPTRIPPRPRPSTRMPTRIPRRPGSPRTEAPAGLHSTLCLPPRFMDANGDGDLTSRPSSADLSAPRMTPASRTAVTSPPAEPRPDPPHPRRSKAHTVKKLRRRISAVAAAIAAPVARLARSRRRWTSN